MIQSLIQFCGKILVFSGILGLCLLAAELIWFHARYWTSERYSTVKEPQNTKKIAVITGASGGLGAEYVRQVDAVEKNIDEIWLIARRKDRLESLQKSLSHPSQVFAVDLTDAQQTDKLRETLSTVSPDITLLINCAGYGKIGNVGAIPEAAELGMIDLNDRASVLLTELALPYMNSGSRIMEICSTSAFQSFQKLAVYAASKAFLLRYSRALRMELLPKGIRVTAVCPYWIKDTEFIPTAETEASEKKAVRGYPLAGRAQRVAKISLTDSRIGLPVSTPGIVCTLHRLFSKLIPDEVLGYLWEGIRRL